MPGPSMGFPMDSHGRAHPHLDCPMPIVDGPWTKINAHGRAMSKSTSRKLLRLDFGDVVPKAYRLIYLVYPVYGDAHLLAIDALLVDKRLSQKSGKKISQCSQAGANKDPHPEVLRQI